MKSTAAASIDKYKPSSSASLSLYGKHAHTKLPKPGAKMALHVHGKVRSVSMHQHGEDDPHTSIELDVHKLGDAGGARRGRRGSLSDLIAAAQAKRA